MTQATESRSEMNSLIRRRGQIKAHITQVRRIMQDFTPDCIAKLKVWVSKLHKDFDTLDDLAIDLENLDITGNHAKEHDEIRENIVATIADIENLITSTNQIPSPRPGIEDATTVSPLTIPPNRQVGIRLPELSLPKFDGNYQGWLSFRDKYESTIHRHEGLSDVQKLQYLRSCLSGDAEKVISSLSTTTANYHEAWEQLQQTFNHKRTIARGHYRAIDKIPSMTRDCPRQLGELVHTVQSNLRSLKTLGMTIEQQWEAMLYFKLEENLDKTTRTAWNRELKNTDIPSLDKFLEFLRTTILNMELESTTRERTQASTSRPTTTIKRASNHRSTKAQTFVTQEVYKCGVCKGAHPVFKCEEFHNLTKTERNNKVSQERLCHNCLRSGHTTVQCFSSKRCSICQGKHHSLLHVNRQVTSSTTSQENHPSTTRL